MNRTPPSESALRKGLSISCAAALAGVVAMPQLAAARPQPPVITQVTNNTVGDIEYPRIRTEKGNSIVFVSDGDVLGAGTAPGHREVYLYNTDSGTFSQISNSLTGESYHAAKETDSKHSFRPVYIPFISSADLDTDPSTAFDNSDGNPELFIHFTESGVTRQMTNTAAPAVTEMPYGSDGGKCIVYASSADLEDNDGSDPRLPTPGHNNADGSMEVFMTFFKTPDLSDPVTTQLSNGPAGTTSTHPATGGFWFTRQCRSTVFETDHDQLNNGSTGKHIYVYTKTGGTLEQLSEPGDSISQHPDISGASNFARGPFAVFESNMDPMDNGNTGFEVYRFRIFNFELVQYSNSIGFHSELGSISDGGGRIAFVSTGEQINSNRPVRGGGTPPFNADGNSEIFWMQGKRIAAQLTQTTGCENNFPTVKDNARAMAFRSTCDLVPGNNPAGVPQIFHYQEVKRRDPLNSAGGCLVADGCCNVPNGCYEQVYGSKNRPRRTLMRPYWD